MSDLSHLELELRDRLAQLEQDRAAWEFERDQLIKGIQEQAAHLHESWQELESQRRSMLQTRANSAVRATRQPQTLTVAEVLPSGATSRPQATSSVGPSLADQFRTLQRDVHLATSQSRGVDASIGEYK